MDDREKLVDLITDILDFVDWDSVEALVEYLVANGAVIQKQGEWRYIEDDIYCYAQCSNCFEELVLDELTFEDVCEYSHYCPNCGAKMRGVN